MTRKELPAQAANIRRSIGSSTICTSATVDSMKSFLLNTGLILPQEKNRSIDSQGSRLKHPPPRATKANTKKDNKGARVTSSEAPQEEVDLLHLNERWMFATEAINIILKALTDAIKNPPLKVDPRKPPTKPTSIANNVNASQQRSSLPLQPISVNCVSAAPEEACKAHRLRSTVSPNNIQGLRAQAECARVAFAALRSMQMKTSLCNKMPRLQLESGMSALISKLIALGFDDLATKELRILKRRLDSPNNSFTKDDLGSAELNKDLSDCIVLKVKETLANILYFETTTTDENILALIVTSQLQALKLISSKASANTVEATVEHLQISSPHSPANFIERLMAEASPESQSKIARQFESLIHSMLALCNKTTASAGELKSDSQGEISPQIVLSIQMIVLEIRLKWWNVSGHNGNFSKKIMEPLVQNLTSFRRRSTLTPVKTYEIAKNAFTKLTNCGMTDIEVLPVKPEFRESPLCSAYQLLADFAQESNHYDEAVQWLQDAKNSLRSSGGSPSKICVLLCRIANLQIRRFLAGARHDKLLCSMKEASESLQGDLRGEGKDLDDLLLAVAALRKSAFSIPYEHQKSAENFECTDLPAILNECLNLITLGISFLVRYLGRSPGQGDDDRVLSRYERRKGLVRNNTNPFFESLAAITRFSLATHMEDWERLDAGLQECIRLTSTLNDLKPKNDLELNDQGLKELNVIPLSNAYWYRYLFLKAKPDFLQESQSSLRKSIFILRPLTVAEKLAGLLHTKLESLGLLYEASKDYAAATNIYTEALELHVDGGLLDEVAKSAASRPLAEVFGEKSEISTFGRLLSAYPRVSLKAHSQDSEKMIFFDSETLQPTERGILLEQQLTTIALILQVQSHPEIIFSALRSLAIIILSIYNISEFPIRRLRASFRLLQIHITYPGAIGIDLVDQILQEKTQPLEADSCGFDSGLYDFGAHLVECRDVYTMLLNGSFNVQIAKRNLTSWHRMVRENGEYSSLQRRVSDIASWVLELEFLAEYLEMQGLELLRLTTLYIIAAIQEARPSTDPAAITSILSILGLQSVRLGYPKEACLALHKARKYFDESKASAETTIRWNIVSAEFALASGNPLKSEEHLSIAQRVFEKDIDIEKLRHSTFKERNRMIQLISDAIYIYSLIAAVNGQFSKALSFARKHVKLAHRAWGMLEQRVGKLDLSDNTEFSENDNNVLADQISKLSIEGQSPCITSTTHAVLQSAPFWPLVPRLFRGLVHLSRLFAHGGLFLEAQYYLEQSQKISHKVNSKGLKSQSLSLLGDIITRNGQLEQGMATMQQALEARSSFLNDHHMVSLQLFLANNLTLQSKKESAADAFESAENITEQLMTNSLEEVPVCQPITASHIEMKIGELKDPETFAPRKTRTSKKAQVKTSMAKSAIVAEPSSPKRRAPDATGVSLLWQIKGRTLRQRANVAICGNCINKATSYLQEAAKVPSLAYDQMQNVFLNNLMYLRQAIERMAADPVFCILLESTISQPSVFIKQNRHDAFVPKHDLITGTEKSPSKKVPVKGSVKKAGQTLTTSPLGFLDLLQQIQGGILSIYNLAKSMGSVTDIHAMADILTKTLTMLSAITLSQSGGTPSSSFALYIMELGRTISTTRAHLAIRVEQHLSNNHDYLDWPKTPKEANLEDITLSSTDNSLDFVTFQSRYIDIIPPSWTVLSLSLNESHDEIRIARVRSGQSPFILTLPLNRHSARDPEEDPFGFENGKDELQEIIHLTNYSSHNGQDMNKKGAKTEWWKVRAALDVRLQGLLYNIENFWLGGFRGIFSRAVLNPELLSSFQHSLQTIFDKHLPSRQKPKRKKKSSRMVLDFRVLELFVGLGIPDELENLDESLTDLLYFVVDIFQFHGERNAYDEIDFDSISVEVIDALNQYHEAAKNEPKNDKDQHTILILDKALHCFPWESLPCMDGHAVSRLPSFGCLRDRIMQQKNLKEQEKDQPLMVKGGFHVNRDNGAAILNPAGDLTATQAKFEQPLEGLTGWETIMNRAPSENEMKACLETREIFLYFGHGSGAQYIRPRTIKKLEKCAVALLMGCSSGVLQQAGEFEPYGTPMNYMLAGCPALLATLWDVTDRDIDKFSYDALEKWGFWGGGGDGGCDDGDRKPPGPISGSSSSPVKKAASKKRRCADTTGPENSANTSSSSSSVSLDQAVASSRDSCKFRYLNGAAPVVYGIPVFLS